MDGWMGSDFEVRLRFMSGGMRGRGVFIVAVITDEEELVGKKEGGRKKLDFLALRLVLRFRRCEVVELGGAEDCRYTIYYLRRWIRGV